VDRVLGIEAQLDGTVATLLHEDDATIVVMDTCTVWRAQVGNNPVLILARMLASQADWAASLGVEAQLPTPAVLKALEEYR
jgi:hypothetical protein